MTGREQIGSFDVQDSSVNGGDPRGVELDKRRQQRQEVLPVLPDGGLRQVAFQLDGDRHRRLVTLHVSSYLFIVNSYVHRMPQALLW